MPQVTCNRCFRVFAAARPGAAPLCPSCAPRGAEAEPATAASSPGPGPRAPRHDSGRRPTRPGPLAALAAAAALAALSGAGLVAVRRARAAHSAPARAEPSAAERAVAEWRAAGLVPPASGPADPAGADAHVAAGRAALEADLPARTREALAEFRLALALDPRRGDAAAGYATAFAQAAGEDAGGAELRAVHELAQDALLRGPGRPDLLAAWARLLLAVPSPSNVAEAAAAARRALAAAPADPAVRLAAGLAALASDDPAGAADALEAAAGDSPGDRRLLSASAVARWAAGDPARALALARRRLALDPGHPGALALEAEILAASDRPGAARAALSRWQEADPGSPLPPLLLARLAYQVEGDLPAARRLLDAALARGPDDFQAARILAHRAAVERAGGDAAAATRTVGEALRRVPASAPARFQAALLAFGAGDAAALRESAGVLGGRAGPLAAALLAARSAELSGTFEEAEGAHRALAAAAALDPAVLLCAGAGLARLRASGPALALAARALRRDPLEARLGAAPTEFWEGPAPLADAARRFAEIARAESRGGATASSAAALAELLLGHTVAAEAHARAARLAAPQSPAPAALLAQIALERGQAAAALAWARFALAAGGDPAARGAAARALEALGKRDEAERAWRDALEAEPDLATAKLGLGRLLLRRGELAEGRLVLAELLRERPGAGAARGALLGADEAVAAAAGGGRSR